MIDLTALEDLRQWMIEHRVAHVRCGEYEITLTDHAFHVESGAEEQTRLSELAALEEVAHSQYQSPYHDPDLWGGNVPRLPRPAERMAEK